MIRSLFRRSAILSLVGSTLLASFLGGNFQALALPEQQILEKLQSIPVFTLADDQGVPLVQIADNEQKVTGVFISRQDAQTYLELVQKNNPEVAKQFKVQPVSLEQVYKLQEAQKESNELIVDYVPTQAQVELAKKLSSENGEEYKGGVPLFVAKAGKEQGYLMINQNNQAVIPMFFEKEPATALAEEYKKQKPELASTVKIEVVPLEVVIGALKESDDQMLTKIVLIPTKETITFIQENFPKDKK